MEINQEWQPTKDFRFKAQSHVLGRKSNTVVFTACSLNYLVKAMAMVKSVQSFHSDVDLIILLVDRKRSIDISDSSVRILWSEELDFPDYLECAFKYNIIELNTALKPFTTLKLLKEYQKVIYLDPDICVFSPLTIVISTLDRYSTIFTPHALSPFSGAGRPVDQDLLRFGCFNLGFFAANNSTDAQLLLNWWHIQCLEYCFYEPQAGYGVDQKWIDLAPAFFNGVHILKDVGLNVAFWNLHERFLSKSQDVWLVNSKHPLLFVHFSSFVETDRNIIADKQTRYAPGSRPDFAAVGDVYRSYLKSAKKIITTENTEYGYAYFDNGMPISPSLRRFYAIYKMERFVNCLNPFLSSGPIYYFAKENNLLSNRSTAVSQDNFKSQLRYAKERRIMATIFRWLLWLLGPDRYFVLLRFLAHYSSILNQKDVIKY